MTTDFRTTVHPIMERTFLEFFAGGGMARAGLGTDWRCVFANDFDFRKASTYKENWGIGELQVGDVRQIQAGALPTADLAWASFPCQDLSLAGGGAGLKGERSGTFFPFWKLISELDGAGRGPKLIALENVLGTLTSHHGADFRAICASFAALKYRVGAVVIDAELFVPHSRPRLFIVGVHESVKVDPQLVADHASLEFHPKALTQAVHQLPEDLRRNWIWWRLALDQRRSQTFSSIVESVPRGVEWNSDAETRSLLDIMSELHRAKVAEAKRSGERVVGTIYKRTRVEDGVKVQRAEVRFDNVAGCLRTPAGGSSRQTIIVVEGSKVRTRLISARETARLMGLPDSYVLPERYNEAYHLTGDGVVVPVVRFLSQQLFLPLLGSRPSSVETAA